MEHLTTSTTNTTPRPRTAMISGHIDISDSDFATHYIPAINLALSRKDHFILGDAQGTDMLALAYLLQHGGADIKHRITIYASRLYNVAKFAAMALATSADTPADTSAKEVSDRATARRRRRRQGDSRARHLQRDARMTRASDYDILWVRSEEETRALYGDKYRNRVSATELNRLRRLEVLEEVWKGGAEAANVINAENSGGEP
jgi:ABC-type Na+ efflux pump permease subunit